jgi:Glycosyl hydrolase family 26
VIRHQLRAIMIASAAVLVALCLLTIRLLGAQGDPAAAAQDPRSTAPSASTAPAPDNAPSAPAGDQLYLGVDSDADRVGDFNQALQISHPAILGGYTATNGDLASLIRSMSAYPQSVPMLSWQLDFSSDEIVDGKLDAYLKTQAAAILAYAKPIFIRPDWEMNGNWSPWDYPQVTPPEYVAAWRYLVSLFHKAGATNAAFVWCPNVGDFTTFPVSAWYPGNAYVDWIGVDAYPSVSSGDTTLTEPDGLNQIARFAVGQGRPLMLAEWGATLPGTDSAWVFDTVFQWARQYPQTVKALVYFNYGVPTRDHLLSDLPTGTAAFRTLIQQDPEILFTIPVVANPRTYLQ